MSKADRIVVGVVTGPHGVRGLLRIKSFTEDPADITSYSPLTDQLGQRVFALDFKGPHKGQYLAELKGCDDRTKAEALKGEKLYYDAALLPDTEDEDEFYIRDLIGLELRDEQGEKIGRIKAMHDFGASDVMEVTIKGIGPSQLWPFTLAIIPELHIAEGWALCVPPAFTEARDDADRPSESDH